MTHEERTELVDSLDPYWRGLYDRDAADHAAVRVKVADWIAGIKDAPCPIALDRVQRFVEFEVAQAQKAASGYSMSHFPDGRSLFFRLAEAKWRAQTMWLRRQLAWLKGHMVDYVDFMAQRGTQELISTDEYYRRLSLRFPY